MKSFLSLLLVVFVLVSALSSIAIFHSKYFSIILKGAENKLM